MIKTILHLLSTTLLFSSIGYATQPQEILQNIKSITFQEILTAKTQQEKNQLLHSSKVMINGKEQTLNFTSLMATGHRDNNETFGQIKDINNTPIRFEDGSPYICYGLTGGADSGLDFSSILQKNNKLYMVSQFECNVGAMYMFELEQNQTTGELKAKKNTLQFISQKDEFGGFVHCSGQATPWNSHLGSEEYEIDAKFVEANADKKGLTGSIYYDKTAHFFAGDARKLNPYFYGWIPEVQINQEGKPNYSKHYAMGRFSHELAFVMPDRKTVYMSDDGTNVGLFMFVADQAEDLSAGQLYAAKLKQQKKLNGGKFTIEWIDLGHATDAEIRDIIANKPKFSDFFETVSPNIDHSCPVGFTSINSLVGHECLKIKKGANEKILSRVETRRYAALKGATTELRKEEGITFDPVNHKLYIAISEVTKGMEDNSTFDKGGNNHIRLEPNYCGAVYELELDKAYRATHMETILQGTMIEKDSAGNRCDLNGISNPDNITMLTGTNILTIAEDTKHHNNSIVWAYDLKEKKLTRLISAPLKAETTSPFWYTDINGWGYLTTVTQHPSKESMHKGQSSVGVLGPIRFK